MTNITRRGDAEAHPRHSREKPEFKLFKTVAMTVTAALATVAGTLTVAIWGLGLNGKITQSTSSVISLAQLAFGLVAGVGAAIGLALAYRRHQIAEKVEAREDRRLFNERFDAAATQLASDLPAVRLAGVYSVAGLADDWHDGRQQCIDVLCANVRRGFAPEPLDASAGGYLEARLAWKDNQEFRHTIIRVIAHRLRADAQVSWQGHVFDFTGATVDGGDFAGIQIAKSTKLKFYQAEFIDSETEFDFLEAEFTGGVVDFTRARFGNCLVSFDQMSINDGTIDFKGAEFTVGTVNFNGTKLSGGEVDFSGAEFTGSSVNLDSMEIDGGRIDFAGAKFLSGAVIFAKTRFLSGEVDFYIAHFEGGEVSFHYAELIGSRVDFTEAQFESGNVNFALVADWSTPPTFAFQHDSAPLCVHLPTGTEV